MVAGCTNVSTLQSAVPLAPNASEFSAQGWAIHDPTPATTMVLPALAYRQGAGAGWDGDAGARITFPGNLQIDGKARLLQSGPLALSLGLGMGTDLVSLISDDDDDDDATDDNTENATLTFDLFVPFVASYAIVEDYLSLHATARPQLWLVTLPQEDTSANVFLSGALGVRAGKDFGIHVEAAPVWSSHAGLVFGGAAALFLRFDTVASTDANAQ